MFRVKCTHRKGWLRVQPSGELDLQSSHAFQTALQDAVKKHQAYRVVLDLSDLSFIDSAGVGAILSSYRFITSLNGEMRLGPIASRVRPVVQLAQLDRLLEPATVHRPTGRGREKNA